MVGPGRRCRLPVEILREPRHPARASKPDKLRRWMRTTQLFQKQLGPTVDFEDPQTGPRLNIIGGHTDGSAQVACLEAIGRPYESPLMSLDRQVCAVRCKNDSMGLQRQYKSTVPATAAVPGWLGHQQMLRDGIALAGMVIRITGSAATPPYRERMADERVMTGGMMWIAWEETR